MEIASLIPLRPSAQRIRISFTPRFFNSFNTQSQYLALSLSPTLIFLPSVFSLCYLYSVYRFLFSCHNKRPPMIFYFIIEDLSKHYLQKKFHMLHNYAPLFPRSPQRQRFIDFHGLRYFMLLCQNSLLEAMMCRMPPQQYSV